MPVPVKDASVGEKPPRSKTPLLPIVTGMELARAVVLPNCSVPAVIVVLPL